MRVNPTVENYVPKAVTILGDVVLDFQTIEQRLPNAPQQGCCIAWKYVLGSAIIAETAR